MVGGKTPETCWAVNKRQDNKLENYCIWLVICLNCTMMDGLTNLKFKNILSSFFFVKSASVFIFSFAMKRVKRHFLIQTVSACNTTLLSWAKCPLVKGWVGLFCHITAVSLTTEGESQPLQFNSVNPDAGYPDRQLSGPPTIRTANYPDRQLSGTPTIRTANYPDRQLSGSSWPFR
jgi:hypothetical protein